MSLKVLNLKRKCDVTIKDILKLTAESQTTPCKDLVH